MAGQANEVQSWETAARMWHVIADLHRELGQAVLYLRNVELHRELNPATETVPLQLSTLDRIRSRWPE